MSDEELIKLNYHYWTEAPAFSTASKCGCLLCKFRPKPNDDFSIREEELKLHLKEKHGIENPIGFDDVFY